MQKKIHLVFVTLATIFFHPTLYAQNLETERPNIILFLVDDMGWTDTSVPFGDSPVPNNQVYDTPNMQRLADKGVRFANA